MDRDRLALSVPRETCRSNRAFFAYVSASCIVTLSSSGNRDTGISVAGRTLPSRASSTNCNTRTRFRSPCTCAIDFQLDNLRTNYKLRLVEIEERGAVGAVLRRSLEPSIIIGRATPLRAFLADPFHLLDGNDRFNACDDKAMVQSCD